MNIEVVIRQCLDNDIRGKELMYKSFYGYINAIIIRYVTNRFDTEELINDTFVKVFRHLPHFIVGKNTDETLKMFKGWMARIASNTAIDYVRKNHRLPLFDSPEGKHETYTPCYINTDIEVKDIIILLNQLSDTQRIIFNMHEIEGYTHEEIATHLNITANSSRVILVRTKKKLQKLYISFNKIVE